MTDPVEIARRLNDWWSATPFELLKRTIGVSDSFEDAVRRDEFADNPFPEELISEEVELISDAFPGGAILPSGRGRDVLMAFFREWIEPWEYLSVEPQRYERIGESEVLTEIHVEARGGASGATTELEMAQLWTVADGLLVRYAIFPDADSARSAALAGERSE
jgi:ketosteroid isomerase-like protein